MLDGQTESLGLENLAMRGCRLRNTKWITGVVVYSGRSPARPLTHSLTHLPTHSLTHPLTHSPAHPLTHPLTHLRSPAVRAVSGRADQWLGTGHETKILLNSTPTRCVQLCA